MSTLPRRRFQFSLRTMLALLTAISALVGWIAYDIRWIQQRREIIRLSVDRGRDAPVQVTIFKGPPDPAAKVIAAADPLADPFDNRPTIEPRAPGGLWLFGEQGVHKIRLLFGHGWVGRELTPNEVQEVKRIAKLFPEATVEADARRPRQNIRRVPNEAPNEDITNSPDTPK